MVQRCRRRDQEGDYPAEGRDAAEEGGDAPSHRYNVAGCDGDGDGGDDDDDDDILPCGDGDAVREADDGLLLVRIG